MRRGVRSGTVRLVVCGYIRGGFGRRFLFTLVFLYTYYLVSHIPLGDMGCEVAD